jgi:death-on-curing protein
MIELLNLERVIEIHDNILKHYKGLPGLAGDKSLESALARIQHHLDYEQISEIFEIAAMYGIALAQGHVFNDANKRTALISMKVFLEINGYELLASNAKAEEIVIEIAKKSISLDELSIWIKRYTKRMSKQKDLIEE